MERLIRMVLECTLTMSVVAVTILLLTPWLSRRYSARTLRAAWLIMLVGFVIPLRPQVVKPAITVPVPPTIVVYTPLRTLALIPAPMAAPESQPAGKEYNAAADSVPAIDFDLVPISTHVSNATIDTAPMSAETSPRVGWPELTVMHLLFACWLAGMITTLIMRLVQHKRFLGAVRRWSRPITGTLYQDALEDTARKLGLRKTIGLYHCPIVDSPMLIGLFRARILLPEKVKSLAELDLILRHELIHLRRHDLWGRLLLLVASAIHWFNPLMRPISHAFSVTCEEACDAAVTRGMTIDMRQYYSHTILRSIHRRPTLATALSTRYSGGKKTMKKRLTQILDGRRKKLGTVVVTLLLVAVLGAGMALALGGQETNPVDEPDEVIDWGFMEFISFTDSEDTTYINEDLADIIEPVGRTFESDALKVTVIDAAYDGRSCVVSWIVKNKLKDTPVYVMGNPTFNGSSPGESTYKNSYYYFIGPGETVNAAMATSLMDTDHYDEDTCKISLYLAAFIPTGPLVELDYEEATDSVVDALIAEGKIPVGENDIWLGSLRTSQVYGASEGFDVFTSDYANRLVDAGLMERSSVVEESFTIEKGGETKIGTAEPAEIDCGDYAIRLVEAVKTPNTVTFLFDAVFESEAVARRYDINPITASQSYGSPYARLYFKDGDGRDYFGIQYSYDIGIRSIEREPVEQPDGTWTWRATTHEVNIYYADDICQIFTLNSSDEELVMTIIFGEGEESAVPFGTLTDSRARAMMLNEQLGGLLVKVYSPLLTIEPNLLSYVFAADTFTKEEFDDLSERIAACERDYLRGEDGRIFVGSDVSEEGVKAVWQLVRSLDLIVKLTDDSGMSIAEARKAAWMESFEAEIIQEQQVEAYWETLPDGLREILDDDLASQTPINWWYDDFFENRATLQLLKDGVITLCLMERNDDRWVLLAKNDKIIPAPISAEDPQGRYSLDGRYSVLIQEIGMGKRTEYLFQEDANGSLMLTSYRGSGPFEEGIMSSEYSLNIREDGCLLAWWKFSAQGGRSVERAMVYATPSLRFEDVDGDMLQSFIAATLKAHTMPPETPPEGDEGALPTPIGIEIFSTGRWFDMYTGPGEDTRPAGSMPPKGGWLQVFGTEDDWALIHYNVRDGQNRFGYILVSALREEVEAPALTWTPEDCVTTIGLTLTDDPLHSGQAILWLPAGTSVTRLASFGSFWAYVEAVDEKGLTTRGFVMDAFLVQTESAPAEADEIGALTDYWLAQYGDKSGLCPECKARFRAMYPSEQQPPFDAEAFQAKLPWVLRWGVEAILEKNIDGTTIEALARYYVPMIDDSSFSPKPALAFAVHPYDMNAEWEWVSYYLEIDTETGETLVFKAGGNG